MLMMMTLSVVISVTTCHHSNGGYDEGNKRCHRDDRYGYNEAEAN
jgi:hypothetical protein